MKQKSAILTENKNKNEASAFMHVKYLLDSLLDLVCIIDSQGYFVEVNDASINVLGYSSKELTGKQFMQMVVEEDREKSMDAVQLLLEGVELNSFENKYYRKDGTIVSLSWSGRCRGGFIYCIARDVTDKKINDSLHTVYAYKLKRQGRQVADILERITDGFIAMDEDWRVIYCNKQAEIILGVKREDILAVNIWEFYPAEADSIFYAQYNKALQEQVPVHFEAFIASLQIWVDVSAYPSENGLSVFFKNSTEKRKAEQELHKLSRIAKQTANTVIITDAAEKIIWVNEAFSRITGYSFKEVEGKVPTKLLQGPETDAATKHFMMARKKAGQSFHAEVLSYKKSGETYWSEVTCEPMFDARGKLQQFFSIEIDITEKKKLQEQLAREQEDRQKNITAAVIKAQELERAQVGQELHDNVNQVLTTVKLYTELCLDGIENGKEIMSKSIQLLNQSINEIRSLSKRLSAPSLGKIPLKESVKELIDAIADTNKVAISLTTNLEGFNAETELHLAVYRILQEHLTNILKHSAARTVKVAITIEGDNLLIKVVDDGRGFNPSDKRNGIGITNMISRAESLGGALQLISEKGQGCTLLINIPLPIA